MTTNQIAKLLAQFLLVEDFNSHFCWWRSNNLQLSRKPIWELSSLDLFLLNDSFPTNLPASIGGLTAILFCRFLSLCPGTKYKWSEFKIFMEVVTLLPSLPVVSFLTVGHNICSSKTNKDVEWAKNGVEWTCNITDGEDNKLNFKE